jgi:hypothetical protein
MLLYFDYSLPFGDFMAQLTDKTRNCTIPPQGVKPRDQQQNNKDFNSHQPVFRVRTNIEKGYSLLDGPWIYRVSPIKLDGQFGTRKPLATAHQYEQMKVDIKDAEKAIKKEGLEGKLRQYIVVIHVRVHFSLSNGKFPLTSAVLRPGSRGKLEETRRCSA